jgi:hypothetical protein
MIARWRAELAAFATLLLIYLATLAPGVTLWDSGEFLSAIHSLGIPHPPGTPLYVLVANVWSRILSPLTGFAFSVNLLSAICTAAACALLANLINRSTGDRIAAYAGAVAAGAMASVWSSATETEVYASALFIGCVILWIANREHDARGQWVLLGAYVSGLGFALHLTALLTIPAAIYLVVSRRGWGDLTRHLPLMIALFILGASATAFMIVRAQHDPFVNQGNPSTLSSFWDVILRKQYAPAPLWPRQAPIFIQVGNLFEYADWQVALGLAPDPPPTVFRTTLSVLFGALGVFGFVFHRRMDRRSWTAFLILFLTATVGVLAYLNLKASPSFGGSFIPANAKHEARERDYFFALAWICWGLWAGIGAVQLIRRLNDRIAYVGALAAFIPVAFNWSAVSRRIEPDASAARREGLRALDATPAHGIVLVHADNDVYPTWYLQEVESKRRDGIVVVVPLLPAEWYRAELARRHALISPDSIQKWRGTDWVVASICRNARLQNRQVVDAVLSPGNNFPSPCHP